tara:strand:- start:795 stop:1448 length:654 start_codon:yes stop_codon:yes gene_type:complete
MSVHRISIRGGSFSGLLDQPDGKTELHVVIVNAANVSRAFYAKDYVPNASSLPTCWSVNTQTPSPDVPDLQKQCSRCLDCTQNIRGSGKEGSGRACRFLQHLAVVEENTLDVVYRLQVPSASIFGKANSGNKMSLEAYSRFLANHGTPSVAVVTKIFFDTASAMPKLCFAAVRALEERELSIAREMVEHEDTLAAIQFTTNTSDRSPFLATDGFIYD